MCTIRVYKAIGYNQGGFKEMSSISWLTNNALVNDPNCGGGRGVAGSQPMSTAVHKSPNKLGDLTPYLTYGYNIHYVIYFKRKTFMYIFVTELGEA
jgi:hypothetical protein